MSFRDQVKSLALHIPVLKRIHAELGALRADRASLAADCKALHEQNETVRSDNNKLADEVAGLLGMLSQREAELRRLKANGSARQVNGNAAFSGAGLQRLGAEELKRYFSAPLADLATTDPKYAGVLCPEPELNRPKVGVTETLLSGAEDYFKKYENFSYIFGLLKGELDALGVEPRGIAVDFGSGFGNTVIPLLENYRELSIVATDISPDLLAILLREASKRGIGDRCAAVALDAQRDYFAEGFADIVFGGAVLHHLAEPDALLKTVVRILKPGGHAIFFEPFENGHSVLRLAYEEILARAKAEQATGPGFDFLAGLAKDIAVRSHRRSYPEFSEAWFNLDDKWLFTHSYFDRMRHLTGASDLRIRPFNNRLQPFTKHTQNSLVNYAGLTIPDSLPDWAWEVLRRFDEDAFSADMRNDLVIEGAVVLTK